MDAEVKPQYDKSELGLWKNFKALIKVPPGVVPVGVRHRPGATVMTCSTYALHRAAERPQLGAGPGRGGPRHHVYQHRLPHRLLRAPADDPQGGARKGYDAMPIMSFGIGIVSCILFAVGYNSFNVPVAQACVLIGGIGMSAMIIAPRTLQIQQPEVAGPRAGTVNGIGGIISRVVGIGLSTLAGIIAAYFNNTSVIMYIL